jgi:hypothetical protein
MDKAAPNSVFAFTRVYADALLRFDAAGLHTNSDLEQPTTLFSVRTDLLSSQGQYRCVAQAAQPYLKSKSGLLRDTAALLVTTAKALEIVAKRMQSSCDERLEGRISEGKFLIKLSDYGVATKDLLTGLAVISGGVANLLPSPAPGATLVLTAPERQEAMAALARVGPGVQDGLKEGQSAPVMAAVLVYGVLANTSFLSAPAK